MVTVADGMYSPDHAAAKDSVLGDMLCLLSAVIYGAYTVSIRLVHVRVVRRQVGAWLGWEAQRRGGDWPRACRSAGLWLNCCLALLLDPVDGAASCGAWLKPNALVCGSPVLPGSCCGRTRRRP